MKRWKTCPSSGSPVIEVKHLVQSTLLVLVLISSRDWRCGRSAWFSRYRLFQAI